jgi:hypothetical protein
MMKCLMMTNEYGRTETGRNGNEHEDFTHMVKLPPELHSITFPPQIKCTKVELHCKSYVITYKPEKFSRQL